MRKEEREITALLSELLRPKPPSAEFDARLRIRLKVEWSRLLQVSTPNPTKANNRTSPERSEEADMEKIQQIIGMAVTDEHFRRQLFEDAESACRKAGFNLSELELAALKNLKADAVTAFAGELDERISKKVY